MARSPIQPKKQNNRMSNRCRGWSKQGRGELLDKIRKKWVVGNIGAGGLKNRRNPSTNFYQIWRSPWISQKKIDHINVLELRVLKYAFLTFSRLHPKTQSIQIQMDSIVALSYLVKMGGTQNKCLTVLSK